VDIDGNGYIKCIPLGTLNPDFVSLPKDAPFPPTKD
jgi:hypothetical protein